jgi:hypothetical protein
MSEGSEEGAITIGEMDRPIEEKEVGPTSIDVTDNQDSIGEVSVTEPQEEKVQEQVPVQQEPKISKRKQKRRGELLLIYQIFQSW